MDDIERFELFLEVRLLYVFICLRFDVNEILKVEEFLKKFNLMEWGVEGGGYVIFILKIVSFLFMIVSRKGDLKEVKRIWDKMCISLEVVDEEVVMNLFRVLFE